MNSIFTDTELENDEVIAESEADAERVAYLQYVAKAGSMEVYDFFNA